MEITFNTPALLFPAISLLMLAYTNRYLALASLIRKLHDEYTTGKENHMIVKQIKVLRNRIHLVRRMQFLGVISFIFCVVTMYAIYAEWKFVVNFSFAVSLLSFLASLIVSLIEIMLSTHALEWELSDMEGLDKTNFLKDFILRQDKDKE